MIAPAKLGFTADGTPYSALYDDVYHSAAGGLAQARHVFLQGSDLPARWRGRERFVVLETGFGLGLNFLATWQAWRDDGEQCSQLHFVSCEKHPLKLADLVQVHRRWPELAPLAAELQRCWPALLPGTHRLSFAGERVLLTLVFAEASEGLAQLAARADAIFLDGFAPDRNPELWSASLVARLTRLAAADATLATWSVASALRQALGAAGWQVDKRPGLEPKRHMLLARLGGQAEPAAAGEKQAVVIGAGIAGSSIAERLAARGWNIQLVERGSGPAQGASGNRAGILRPLPSRDDNRLARLTRAAFLHARRHLEALDAAGLALAWDDCGVLHLAREPMHEQTQRCIAAEQSTDADYLRFVERDEAARLAGRAVNHGGWWFAHGGWVDPGSLCRANLLRHAARVDTLYGRNVASIAHSDGRWRALDAAGDCIATAPVLILANASDAPALGAAHSPLPMRLARGQVTHLAAAAARAPEIVVCCLGYLTPAIDGMRLAGASFIADDADTNLRLAEQRDNLAKVEYMLPGFTRDIDVAALGGRVSHRCMTLDRLPAVGPLADAQAPLKAAPGAVQLAGVPRRPGLYALLGLGSRGLVWSALAAELLACQITGEPLPLEQELVDSLDPARFLLKRKRRES